METEIKNVSVLSKRSRWLLVFFSIALVLSVGSSFYKFFVIRDYPIQAQDVCDPSFEICFVYHCDVAYEECTGDPIADTSYYKMVERNAKNIPLCDPNLEGCTPLVCPEGEVGCSVTFCEPSEEVECSDPVTYLLQNAIEDQDIMSDSQETAPMMDQPEDPSVNLVQ